MLGPYEVVEPIGAGGMGEVYRARDGRLGRDVAIKVSAQRFSERFEREARAVAALNHPNICTLHDVGPDYLVMELVDGETLESRIHAGAVPLDEALAIAKQIADALDAAHEKGIVHRDLKPSNVKIKSDGTVKVLDFGLAKSLGPEAVVTESSATLSPTMTSPALMTQTGVLMGTAAYMAPEQARGKAVDKRADIWAFGVVLWEMLTGERLFKGDDLTETLASVVKDEPPWHQAPARVQGVLRACLEKDPRRRLRDIGDVWRLLEGDTSPSTQAKTSNRGPWIVAAASVLVTIVALSAWTLGTGQSLDTTPARLVRFEVPFPTDMSNGERSYPALSPDGRRLAFVATDKARVSHLFVHAMDGNGPQPVAGTEGAYGTPFWSRDSRSVVFATARQFNQAGPLRTIDVVTGGPPLTIAESPSTLRGGFWTADDTIVFSSSLQGLFKVPAGGGKAQLLKHVRTSESYGAFPSPLPDGKRFVYSRGTAGETAIYLRSLDDPLEREDTMLLENASNAVYVTSSTPGFGYILFVRDETLLAQLFDERTGTIAGGPLPVAGDVGQGPNDPQYWLITASATGTLAYQQTGIGSDRQIGVYDRRGTLVRTIQGTNPSLQGLALSSDGQKLALGVREENRSDLWIVDVDRGGRGTRVTQDAGTNWAPVWSPDGKRLAFQSSRNPRGVYLKSFTIEGREELIVGQPATSGFTPVAWSPDGRYLLLASPNGLSALSDPGTPGGKPIELPGTRGARHAQFSPDGRLIAYSSALSDGEVFVRAFDPANPAASSPAGDVQLSSGGGFLPRWSKNGDELFYGSGGFVMAVTVARSPTLRAGQPIRLFRVPAGAAGWDVAADGRSFINTGKDITPPFTVMLNWQAALRR